MLSGPAAVRTVRSLCGVGRTVYRRIALCYGSRHAALHTLLMVGSSPLAMPMGVSL
jgi:hypothetical protein